MTIRSASSATSSEALSPPRGRAGRHGNAGSLALLVVLFASFMDLLDATIVTVAAPSIARDLAAGETQIQWMLAAYTLALGSGLITGGRVGDDYGRRKVFLVSLAGFAIASALCALAPTGGVLVAMRALQGLAGGFMVPQVFGIIRASFEPAARAKAFGAYGAVQGLAAVAGPLLGGFLVDVDLAVLGWRTIFWVNVPVAVVALVLGWRVLPESTGVRSARLDVVGAVLASAAVLLILLPLVQGRDWGWPAWGWALIGAGVVLLGVFWRFEAELARRGGEPVLEPSLLRIRSVASGLGASLFFFGALGSFFLVLSVYLQAGTGRSAWQAGLVILPYAIGSMVTSGLGVALAAKAGRALLVTGSLVLAASQAVVWWLVRGDADPGYWPLAGALFLGGLGLGLTAPILVNVVLAGVPGRLAGSAGGVLSTVNQIGGAVGVAVLGTVFFNAVDSALATGQAGTAGLAAYASALSAVMPWQVVAYLLAAGLMCFLPKVAVSDR